MAQKHFHTKKPFTIGQSGEFWHDGLDALCVPVPGFTANRDRRLDEAPSSDGCILVYLRNNEYVLVSNHEEHATPDLLMMACYVEDFLQKRTKP